MKKKTTRLNKSLAAQVKNKSKKSIDAQIKKEKKRKEDAGEYKGNLDMMTSTGSTLLDLAISGGVSKYGGIPAGVFVELFGPNSSGKTVLLMEIAGYIQRNGGDHRFQDPEDRLNKGFAALFDFDVDNEKLDTPDTVTEVFKNFRTWEPPDNGKVHGFFIDSLAALSTQMEMTKEEGDKMGGRRGKEFSEGFRKTCRTIKSRNAIMVASNQIRDNFALIGERFTTTGGYAAGFYASVRLRLYKPEKVKSKEKKIGKKSVKRVLGTKVKVEVYKNSCDQPYRTADIYIMNGYGIDDIRANLQYIKDYTTNKTYKVGDTNLGNSLDDAILKVEQDGLENELKKEVVKLWNEIDAKFKIERKPKAR